MPYKDNATRRNSARNERDRARYKVHASTPEGRAFHAAKAARWKQSKSEEFIRQYKARYKHRTRTAIERTTRLAAQGGVCACCGDSNPGHAYGWCLDHDHATGELRDVLCHGCNAALGLLREDETRIFALLTYLRKHRSAHA